MKELEPGRVFDLDCVGGYPYPQWQRIFFFQGEIPGVTVQEVLRVLIARMKYVESQSHSPYNAVVIDHLRSSLYDLECRAHVARGVKLDDPRILPLIEGDRVEDLPACPQCGHVCCTLH